MHGTERPRTVKHACGASIIAPAQEIIAVEGYFDSSLGALQVRPRVRRLGRPSPLTSVKTITFRDMRPFTSAKNRLQSDADGVLLVPGVQAFRLHTSLPLKAGVGSAWMQSLRLLKCHDRRL